MQATADFRSDTMTTPTTAMRQAMADAVVGDDVWGEDPTVIAPEERGADLLGKQAALYVPSGTMANQIAIHLHCRPGDELICEERSHVYYYEGGGIARWSGTQVRTLSAADGFVSAEQITAAVRADDPHYPRSRLLVIENTHNMAGGRVADVARMQSMAAAAHAQDLLVHVDGARLCNAAAALGVAPAKLIEAADSSTLCLSKGLGAPVGSMLAGTEAFVQQARRARKAFGGGMRQAGVLAAAALLALDNWEERLAVDHNRARELATGLAGLPWADVQVEATDSNIVMVDVADGVANALVAHLEQHGVRAACAGPNRIRFVLHRDLAQDAVARCLTACEAFAAGEPDNPRSEQRQS